MSSPSPACPEYEDLLAAAALHVLDDGDARRVRQHLPACHACDAALAAMEEASTALAEAVPLVEPPPFLRARLMQAARAERQPRGNNVRRFLWNRAAGWLSAAAILVSVSTGIWAATLQLQVRDLTLQAQTDREKAQRYDRVVRVLESRSLVIREMAPAAASTSARGTVYLDPMSGSGMVMVSELPWIRPDRAWQIWFVSADGQRRTGGLLRVDPSGTGYTLISVPNDLDRYEGVGITEEPATGSPQPTTPRIVGAPL